MKLQNLTLKQTIPYIFIVCGVIGLICAFVISIDKVDLLKNPSFQPNCDLNPIISCGSVMSSKQGSVFGFPNPWIGLIAFTVPVMVGLVMLAGAKLKRWFWAAYGIGVLAGLAFALWLLFESVYRINALCPYCLAVDVAVFTMSWYTLLYLIENRTIRSGARRWKQLSGFIRRHHLDILLLWFLVVIALILKHFWYYYGHYL